jgi:hypothetical protein
VERWAGQEVTAEALVMMAVVKAAW